MPVHLPFAEKQTSGWFDRATRTRSRLPICRSRVPSSRIGPLTRLDVGARGVLLVVSDGLGGHKAGEVASRLVVDSLRQSLASKEDSSRPEVALEAAAKRANRDVWEAARAPGREKWGDDDGALCSI